MSLGVWNGVMNVQCMYAWHVRVHTSYMSMCWYMHGHMCTSLDSCTCVCMWMYICMYVYHMNNVCMHAFIKYVCMYTIWIMYASVYMHACMHKMNHTYYTGIRIREWFNQTCMVNHIKSWIELTMVYNMS